MPYLSRRLLSDNNPRMRAALRQLLYGKKNRLDVERLSKMISAFGSFTTASASAQAAGPTFSSAAERAYSERVKGQGGGGWADDGPVVNEATREVLKVVFSKDGSYAQVRGAVCGCILWLRCTGHLESMNSFSPMVVTHLDERYSLDAFSSALRYDQPSSPTASFAHHVVVPQELIVEEMVAAVDAMSREALGEALKLVLSSAGAVTALRSVEALGPLRSMLMPLPLPMDMLYAMAPTVQLTQEDRQVRTGPPPYPLHRCSPFHMRTAPHVAPAPLHRQLGICLHPAVPDMPFVVLLPDRLHCSPALLSPGAGHGAHAAGPGAALRGPPSRRGVHRQPSHPRRGRADAHGARAAARHALHPGALHPAAGAPHGTTPGGGPGLGGRWRSGGGGQRRG